MFNKPGSKLILTALICQALILIIHLLLYLCQDTVFAMTNAPGAFASIGMVWNIPETVQYVLGVVIAGATLFAVITAKNMKSALTASVAGLICMMLSSLIFMIMGRFLLIIFSRKNGADMIAARASITTVQSMLIWLPSAVSSICFAVAAGRLSWHKELDPADAPYPAYRE